MDATLVTVVIPCYNGERFIAEALTSALTQTHPAVEIIVIDDGSTDNSCAVVQSFPVRYISQPNSGLCAARNIGITASHGQYIVFLDADDRLLPDAIACGLRALAEHPACAMAVGEHAFISSDGSRIRDSGAKHATPTAYEALLKSNFIEMISSILFRRIVFEEAGAFNKALQVAEDYDLYLRIARQWPICCHTALTAEYRLHTNNTSRNSELMLIRTLQVLKTQESYVLGDAARTLAFRVGMRTWSRQYGRKLARELSTSPSTLSLRQLSNKLQTLVRCYPQGVLLFLALCLQPRWLRGQVKELNTGPTRVFARRRAFGNLRHAAK